MQEYELYEYAVIRVVPKVEREEFVNAGIIVFCKKQNYLACKTYLNRDKIGCLMPGADIDQIEANLAAYENIALGKEVGSAIARMDKPSRFRWLTATRSTIVQSGKVHPGMCKKPDEIIERLFKQLVK